MVGFSILIFLFISIVSVSKADKPQQSKACEGFSSVVNSLYAKSQTKGILQLIPKMQRICIFFQLRWQSLESLLAHLMPFDEGRTVCENFIDLLSKIDDITCSGKSSSISSEGCQIVTEIENFLSSSKGLCSEILSNTGHLSCSFVVSEISKILGDVCDPSKQPKYINPHTLSTTELSCYVSETLSKSLKDMSLLCPFAKNSAGRDACGSILEGIEKTTEGICGILTGNGSISEKQNDINLIACSFSRKPSVLSCKTVETILKTVNLTKVCEIIPSKYSSSLRPLCDDLTQIIPDLVDSACKEDSIFEEEIVIANATESSCKKFERLMSEFEKVKDFICSGSESLGRGFCYLLDFLVQKFEKTAGLLC